MCQDLDEGQNLTTIYTPSIASSECLSEEESKLMLYSGKVLCYSRRKILALRGKQLENAREQFRATFRTLAFNAAFVKVGKSHTTYPICVRSGQICVIWKPS